MKIRDSIKSIFKFISKLVLIMVLELPKFFISLASFILPEYFSHNSALITVKYILTVIFIVPLNIYMAFKFFHFNLVRGSAERAVQKVSSKLSAMPVSNSKKNYVILLCDPKLERRSIIYSIFSIVKLKARILKFKKAYNIRVKIVNYESTFESELQSAKEMFDKNAKIDLLEIGAHGSKRGGIALTEDLRFYGTDSSESVDPLEKDGFIAQGKLNQYLSDNADIVLDVCHAGKVAANIISNNNPGMRVHAAETLSHVDGFYVTNKQGQFVGVHSYISPFNTYTKSAEVRENFETQNPPIAVDQKIEVRNHNDGPSYRNVG